MTTAWFSESWQVSARANGRTPYWRYWCTVAGLALADALSFLIAFLLFRSTHSGPALAFYLGRSSSAPATLDIFTVLALTFIGIRYLSGDYSRRYLFWDGAKTTTTWLLVAAIPELVVIFASKELYTLMPLLASWLFLIITVPVMRQGARAVMAQLHLWRIPTAIIGVNSRTAEVYEALQHSLALGFDVRWLVVEAPDTEVPENLRELFMVHSSDPILIANTVLNAGCDEAICTAEDMQSTHFAEVTRRLLELNIPITIIPSLTRLPLADVTTNFFFGRDILMLQARSNMHRLPWRILKRSFDIAVSGILLVLLSPLFLTISILIKRAGPGKITYSQTRIGRHSKPFKCVKFRTMVMDAEARLLAWKIENPSLYAEYLRTFKLRNDPRVTQIGRWLRKTSLDELPQLFNVLRGDMSLVGPRPVVAKELEDFYGPAAQLYIRTRPGMTGLWQVSGRSDTSYEKRVILDEWYILNWSFWYDIVILIQTAWIVATGKGAF
jgi:undecaprenyl-phosphate galactose phosphotransferase